MDSLKNTDINVVLDYYDKGMLKEYLSLLDDKELDIVGVNVISTNKLYEKKELLELIKNEKAYRHYRDILDKLKEGKTK